MISSSMIRLANIVNRENNEYEIHCLEESRDQTTSFVVIEDRARYFGKSNDLKELWYKSVQKCISRQSDPIFR
jgi:hypothetical protein